MYPRLVSVGWFGIPRWVLLTQRILHPVVRRRHPRRTRLSVFFEPWKVCVLLSAMRAATNSYALNRFHRGIQPLSQFLFRCPGVKAYF